MKKVLTLILTLLLCFMFSATASAKTASSYVVQPYYEKAQEAKSILNINDTDAICESSLAGDPDVIKIVAVQALEKQGFLWIWGTYDDTTWTKTVYTNTLTMSNTKSTLPSSIRKCGDKHIQVFVWENNHFNVGCVFNKSCCNNKY